MTKRNRSRKPLGKLLDFMNLGQRRNLSRALLELTEEDHAFIKILGLRLERTTIWENGRTVTRAGQANYVLWEIELHPLLLEKDQDRHLDLANTLMHEIAHLLSYWIFKGRGHGEEWKKTMTALGQSHDLARCHSYAYMNRNYAEKCKVTYTCLDCGYQIHRTRRWSVQRFHPGCRLYSEGGRFVLTNHPNKNLIKRI